jgi:hypothetical protein
MLYPQPQAPRKYTQTRWKNENPFPQKAELDGELYEWAPGEELVLSSKYDNAIQNVQGGVTQPDGTVIGGSIVGGLAPRLTKVSVEPEKRAVLHESLDPDLQARRAAEAAAIVAQKEVETAQTNAILAQSKADKAKAPAEQSASKSK